MKKKMLYIMLSFIIITVIAIIIFNQTQTKPIVLEAVQENIEKEMQETESELEQYAMGSIEEDDEEEEELNESKQRKLPERISEVVSGTIDFFKDKTRIVAIGDSLTQGVGDQTKRGGYIGILERTINATSEIALFENYGKRGNRSEQLLARIDEEEIISSLEKADIVLITIGANDIMQVAKENIMNLNIEAFAQERTYYEENLNTTIEKILQINPNTSIFLVGFYNPFEKYFQDIKELKIIAESWNSTTNEVANQYDETVYIPIEDLFSDTEEDLFAEDNFHPNYYGYHLIAQRVLEYITSEES
ncbi:SGNH/GDSL hydrolase family protein [Oceanobacillus bengalensis]|uniref:SGNH hydrolase-type esterase domain-containing protein n=1 Tax=Oceanobacillus bengalensis TaxID=1435466 RepID=A0A494Z0B1_9BACI|nr:SGNH/GDSL hydrolase family protein [Oceanobacillus bengalensis]RKQ15876.1 hypothetical protein D8M05_08955 [Oceanobacillus bengalensis]